MGLTCQTHIKSSERVLQRGVCRRQPCGTTANPHQFSVQQFRQQTGQKTVEDLRSYVDIRKTRRMETTLHFADILISSSVDNTDLQTTFYCVSVSSYIHQRRFWHNFCWAKALLLFTIGAYDVKFDESFAMLHAYAEYSNYTGCLKIIILLRKLRYFKNNWRSFRDIFTVYKNRL